MIGLVGWQVSQGEGKIISSQSLLIVLLVLLLLIVRENLERYQERYYDGDIARNYKYAEPLPRDRGFGPKYLNLKVLALSSQVYSSILSPLSVPSPLHLIAASLAQVT